MKNPVDRLYELLPAVYRLRDAERGEPLRALLAVIAEQLNLVEADIGRTYENWFIETCEDWVVPYIGDLLGYQSLHSSGEPTEILSSEAGRRARILTPRRDVANVISYRRRKGVLSLLELLARDAANYPAARVVQFYNLLGWTQSLNFPRPGRGKTLNLRDGGTLDLIGGAFDRATRTVDVRRASSARRAGRANIPGIGVFVWRLKSYSVTETPAYCLEEEAPECYTFSVLGNDTALYNRPQPESEMMHIAGKLNLPIPIRRRALEERAVENAEPIRRASKEYYDRSLSVFKLDRRGELKQIPGSKIIPSNLSDWGKYRPPRGSVAVDPQLGRIIFPPDEKPRHGAVVSYQYAFSADIGGGEYDRPLRQPKKANIYRVGKKETYRTINSALAAWDAEREKQPSAIVEINDSGVYTEPLKIELRAEESLQIRAANRRRPIIRLLDYQASLPDAMTVKGARNSLFALDGLLVAGRSVQIVGPDRSPNIDDIADDDAANGDTKNYAIGEGTPPDAGDLCRIEIRHCTLVPGWSLQNNCEPQRPNEPSLELFYTRAQVNIEHSILGTIEVEANERAEEPQTICISDSIVDATGEKRLALGTNENRLAYVNLRVERSTVIGRVKTHRIALAENSIFKGTVTVGRRQHGCVRFCYVPSGSRTPPRYRCQPDLVERAVDALKGSRSAPTDDQIEQMKTNERGRVEPQFDSERYGAPTYCRLAETCAEEITRGADDESEMGAFHDLYQPQRESNLRARLDEYTPADAEVGIIYAN